MTDKLCSLKHVVPGSVVEVPEGLGSKGELAVVLSPYYMEKDGKEIYAEFMRKDDGQSFHFYPDKKIDSAELKLVENADFKKAAALSFAEQRITLPELAMSCGCDPEVFVLHGDDSVFPAWEYLPDEKTAALVAKEWLATEWEQSSIRYSGKNWENPGSNYCAQRCPTYWDGAQAEMAPYAKNCLESLMHGIREGLKAIIVAARIKDPKAKLSLRSVVELPAETLKNAADEYIQFHCSRSINIYGDCGEGIPNAREYKYRCSGGHIHLGFRRRFTAPAIEQIVRSLDGILGVVGVSLAAGFDDPERRNSYGRAGECRLPSHGLEYRVLSNFWLSHPAIAMLTFELARAAMRMGESGLFNLCWDASEDEIRECINTCDVQAARNIISRNRRVLAGVLKGIWTQYPDAIAHQMRMKAMYAMQMGIGAVVPEPSNIEGNWDLAVEQWPWYASADNASWHKFSKTIKL